VSLSREAEAFAVDWSVSRETSERLEAYVALLRKWNAHINLVSPRSLDAVWDRHIADSAQLLDLAAGPWSSWADIGSGGGLPGVIVAIMSAVAGPKGGVTLVESDSRKAAFLGEVSRACGVSFEVVCGRAETAGPLSADVLSARALAPLVELLEFADRHVEPQGICLFPKGETVHTEIEVARSRWWFEPRLHASRTNAGSFIVEIGEFERV